MSEAEKDIELAECLELIRKDIGEAIAADELLYVVEHHVNNLPDDKPTTLDPGIQYVMDALAFRMALAVNRLFQSAGRDRANFAQLQSLANSANVTNRVHSENAFKKAAALGASSDLVRLKACRDGFMAHTLRGSLGSRDGCKVLRLFKR